jgi:hypothetical protein
MTPPLKPRNLWPIAITAFFIVVFTCLVGLIVFATRQRVDLVRADYYEEEIRFQQQLDRVNRTQRLSQPAAVGYDAAQRCITINLSPSPLGPVAGQIHLYRPSDARLDQELPLILGADGTQRLDASKLRGGLWKVRVQWAVANQEYYLDQPVVIRPHA